MKLLFDHNLSPKLTRDLHAEFPDAVHVRDVHMKRAPDAVLWDFAKENDYAIVAKDADFSDRTVALGFPPKVI